MINYNNLIGLPIYTKYSSRRIATIKDVLFDIHKKFVIGLVVEKKGLFSHPKYIPIDEIDQIGQTYILVDSNNSIKLVDKANILYDLITSLDSYSVNTEVYSKDDKKIGKVNDIIFNFEVGTIDGFIISNGVIEDIISGRKVVIDENIKYTKNRIYLK